MSPRPREPPAPAIAEAPMTRTTVYGDPADNSRQGLGQEAPADSTAPSGEGRLFGGVPPGDSRFIERLAQVLDQIVHVFEAHRQSEQAGRDPERRTLLRLEPLMGRRLRVGDEALG